MRPRSKLQSCLVLIGLGGLLTGCFRSPPPLPWMTPKVIHPTSVEGLMSKELRNHADACEIVPAKSDEKAYSFVTEEFQRHMEAEKLAGPGELLHISGASLFQYVYSEQEIAHPLKDARKSRFLSFENHTDTLPRPRKGNSWYLARSCAGYAQGSARANTPVPAVVAQTVLKAEFEKKSTLTAIYGQFESPLRSLLASEDGSALDLHLQLWWMYSRDSLLALSPWYMNDFRGVSFRQETGVSYNASLDHEITANLGNLNASSLAGYGKTNYYRALSWRTIIFSDSGNPSRQSRFSPLPSPDRIQRLLARAQTTPKNQGRALVPGDRYTLERVLPGVPEFLCGNGWELKDLHAGLFQPNSVTFQATPEIIKGTPSCVFTIGGLPDSSLFSRKSANSSQSAILQGTVRYTEAVVQGKMLELPLKIDLSVAGQLLATQENPVDKARIDPDADRFSTSWSIDIHLANTDDDPIKLGPSVEAELPPDMVIHCPSGSGIPVRGKAVPVFSRKYRLTLTGRTQSSSRDYDIGKPEICILETRLFVPMNTGNRKRPVSLTANVTFPSKASTIAATAPAPLIPTPPPGAPIEPSPITAGVDSSKAQR